MQQTRFTQERTVPLISNTSQRSNRVSFSLLWAVAKRHWLLLIILFCAINMFSIASAITLPPVFTATATVVIDTRNRQVAPVESVLSPLEATYGAVLTEMDTLRSAEAAKRVIDKLGLEVAAGALASTPHFFRDLKPQRIIADALANLSSDPSKHTPNPPSSFEEHLIAGFQDRLGLLNEYGSFTIRISFKSESPEVASQVANAYASEYVEMHSDQAREAAVRANKWLEERLSQLHKKTEEAASDLQSFRERHQLIDAGGATVSGQQLADLNARLIEARTERQLAEARLAKLKQLHREGRAQTAPEVLDSDLIERLKQQQAELQKRKAELSIQYGERHPNIRNLNAELEDLQDSIDLETGKIVDRIANEVEVARVRERELTRGLEGTQAKVVKDSTAALEMEDIRNEVEINRRIYEDFLTRYKETTNTDTSPGVKVMSVAQRPLFPSSPNKPLIVALGFISSVIIDGCLALFIAGIPRPIRSEQELRDIMDTPPLGSVPVLKPKAATVRSFLSQNARSAVSEALVRVLTNLEFRRNSEHRICMVTSGLPGEGKSTLVTALATVAGQSGRRTYLVDLDLKRQGLSRTFTPSEDAQPKVLARTPEFICRVWEEGAGRTSLVRIEPQSEEVTYHGKILSSPELRRTLATLAKNSDFVLVDTPPVLAVPDAVILGSAVDQIVLVARWNVSTIQEVRQLVQELEPHREKIAGVVLVAVDLKKHPTYGYSDLSSYHKAVQSYYLKGDRR